MTTVTSERRTGRSLLDEDLFDRLTARVAADEQLSSDLAVRIMDQALAFLAACATDHDEPFAPSSQADCEDCHRCHQGCADSPKKK